jgi:hypothetical protein
MVTKRGDGIVSIARISVAVSALVLCFPASAQDTKYYMRQQVAKADAGVPGDTKCGALQPNMWIMSTYGPKPALIGTANDIVGTTGALQWCKAKKPFGMSGSCVFVAAGDMSVGTVYLYRGYLAGPMSVQGYYGANCS